MTRRHSISFTTGVALLALFGLNTPAQAVTIPINDYDNTKNTVTGTTPTNNQTTGSWRDVIWWSINNGQPRDGSPDYINLGKNLVHCGISACDDGTGAYTALNFTGPALSGGQSYMTVYDTTPAEKTDATDSVFDASQPGGITLSTDILFTPGQHNTSGGIFTMFNEGQDALALLLNNAGGNNHDTPKLSLVFQSLGLGTTLASVNLGVGPSPILPDEWYRISMNLTVSGDTWNILGSFTRHSDPTNPNSALGSLITNLNFSGSISDPDAGALHLQNPGEVGLMAQGNDIGGAGCAPAAAGGTACTDNVGVSLLSPTGTPRLFNENPVPEPGSLLLLGSGLLGLVKVYQRKKR